MNYAAADTYLRNLPESTLDYPFGPEVKVYKLGGKIFAILGLGEEKLGEAAGVGRLNLKCDPDQAQALRDLFESVIPGYHMNKKHWNTVILDGSIPCGEVERMIDHSYSLILKSLKKADREALCVRNDMQKFI